MTSKDKKSTKNGPGSDPTTPISPEDTKKTRPEFCELDGCRRKIGLTAYPCYCDKYFCALHLPAEEHVCSFNYHDAAKQKLSEEMKKVEAEKVKKI